MTGSADDSPSWDKGAGRDRDGIRGGALMVYAGVRLPGALEGRQDGCGYVGLTHSDRRPDLPGVGHPFIGQTPGNPARAWPLPTRAERCDRESNTLSALQFARGSWSAPGIHFSKEKHMYPKDIPEGTFTATGLDLLAPRFATTHVAQEIPEMKPLGMLARFAGRVRHTWREAFMPSDGSSQERS